MRRVIWLSVLVPALAVGGQFVSGNAALPDAKVFNKPCTSADPKKCWTEADANAVFNGLYDLRTAIQPIVGLDSACSGTLGIDPATGKLRCYPAQVCGPSQCSAWTGTGWGCRTVATNPVTPDVQQLFAFPGCEGAGCGSTGGRGGTVYNVNTLADTTGQCVIANGVTTGTCSLRDCVEGITPRVCNFRIGGVITLTKSLAITSPYITIAGQTAPGDGIAIRIPLNQNGEAYTHTFSVRTNNVVIRHLKLWGQPCSVSAACSYGIVMKSGYNGVFDHLSAFWFSGEAFNGGWSASPTSPIRNITLSWSILAEPLVYPQSTMMRLSDQGYNPAAVQFLDMHDNLFSSAASRSPSVASDSFRFVSNAIYNWSTFAAEFEHESVVDLIGNYFKPGPTQANGNMNCKVEFSFGTGGPPGDVTRKPSVYMSNNLSTFNPGCASNSLNGLPTRSSTVTGNEADGGWALMTERLNQYQGTIDQFPLSDTWATRRTTPQASSFPITAIAASSVPATLTAAGGVGASRKINCDGTWSNRRDAVDARVISDFLAGTGHDANTGHTTPEDYNGGIPTLSTDAGACPDADHDGMPDLWEAAQGLNPNDPSDGPVVASGQVYTNLERFENGLP